MEQATVPAPPFEELFSGEIVRPGDASYDTLRSVFNGMIDRRPALIARCTGVADVQAAVNHARESGRPLSVYSGGHSVTGHGVCDDGICVDMRPLSYVVVDPKERVAHVGGGAVWGQVDRETQAFGLAVTGGRVPGTGVAGLTLGSGSGWIERKYGLTCDSLRAVDMVLADGSFVRASEDENAELFWGVRGGGGNFGIVTRFEFDLHPVGPIVLGGMLMFPHERAAEVAAGWRDFMATAPDEVGTGLAFLTAPPEEFVPEPVRGQPVVGIVVCVVAPLEEAEGLIAPLRELNPALDIVQPMPYAIVQQLIAAGNPPGLQNYWNADFLSGLPDEAIDVLVRHTGAAISPITSVIVVPGGGAIARVDDDAMAFGERDAPFNLHILSMWEDPAQDEAQIAWTRTLSAEMAPFKRGRAYLNFIGEEGSERVQAAFGPEKYARLVALKDRYDPENLFRLNQNIAPSGS
jgi:FAD/FMN-containing dehydrogenase